MSYKKLLEITAEILSEARAFNDGHLSHLVTLRGMIKALNFLDVYITYNMPTALHIDWIKVSWKSVSEIFYL